MTCFPVCPDAFVTPDDVVVTCLNVMFVPGSSNVSVSEPCDVCSWSSVTSGTGADDVLATGVHDIRGWSI